MSDQKSARAENVGMTPDEVGTLVSCVVEAEILYRRSWGTAPGSPSDDDVVSQEGRIVDYVNTLLAARDVEIERLRAQQVTVESPIPVPLLEVYMRYMMVRGEAELAGMWMTQTELAHFQAALWAAMDEIMMGGAK